MTTFSDPAYTVLDENDTSGIEALLLGRRIVAAEKGEYARPDTTWGCDATGRLTLDNGTHVLVAPNQGDCACSAGDYYLTELAGVDNIITSVRVVTDESQGEWQSATVYRIYVVADSVEINAMTIEGDDGNGYYGTGYELIVLPPA